MKTCNPDQITVYRGDEEWSALYVDGKLEQVGDHYLIDERITTLLQIREVHSDDFMRGGFHRKDVASTLEEIGIYAEERIATEMKADELRAKANTLRAEAAAIEAKLNR